MDELDIMDDQAHERDGQGTVDEQDTVDDQAHEGDGEGIVDEQGTMWMSRTLCG